MNGVIINAYLVGSNRLLSMLLGVMIHPGNEGR